MKRFYSGILIIVLLMGCCPTKPLPVKRRIAAPPAIVLRVIKGGNIVDCKRTMKSYPDFRKNP